jgi:hypothetical protein
MGHLKKRLSVTAASFAIAAIVSTLTTPLAWSQTVTTIDFPGAMHTRLFGINPSDEIVGLYVMPDGSIHGLLLNRNGLTTIDVPGAIFTNVIKINSAGEMVGTFALLPGMFHGYLLSKGSFHTIDFAGARITQANGINARGDIVGAYQNTDGKFHGFLLTLGSFNTIDFPGAIMTQAIDINPQGDILGTYQSADGVFHMFLLSRGVFTSIDFPGALSTGASIIGVGINPKGEIVELVRAKRSRVFGFSRMNPHAPRRDSTKSATNPKSLCAGAARPNVPVSAGQCQELGRVRIQVRLGMN